MSTYAPTLTLSSTETQIGSALRLVLARVRLRACRRAAWLRKLWSEEGEPGGKLAVTHAEVNTHLEDRDAPEAEAAWFAFDDSVDSWNRALADVEAALDTDDGSRLSSFCQMFDLSLQETDVLQACLAIAFDPSLTRVYAYLQDHAGRGYVTEDLVARLFGHGRCYVLGSESPLRTWELVTERDVGPGEPPALACDRLVRDWLLGHDELDEQLIGIATFYPPLPPLGSWPVAETAGLIAHTIKDGRARVRVSGSPGSGRRTLAACISAELGLPLLAIDADQIDERGWRRLFVRAQRQAYLDRCALAWHGESVLQRTWPLVVPHFPVQFVICEPGQVMSPLPDAADYLVEMPPLSLDERRELWCSYVPTAATWPARNFEMLMTQHRVTVGQIAAIALRDVEGPTQAAALVREAQRHRLGKLAQALECPFDWDDLVVSDSLREALQDFVFEARERVAFWERPEAQRLFPQGRGLLALFSGPPGTGKTMAAQIIAASLGLDLFRIDLSSVVSKYVGETSQNLERILSRAEYMDVVLLFDEADALFGKRTEIRDAHDRFANTDTGYLLQAIENYRGVALLATNKMNNIDSAFIRRLRYVLEFPRPDGAQRLHIWRRIVGELAGPKRLEALTGDLEKLACDLEVTGAQIKFAILVALFAAQHDEESLGTRHLLRGLDRELMKEGRALSERERERLMGNGR